MKNFDELERHIAAARRALTAPDRAALAAATVRDVRKRVYLQVNKHYAPGDDIAEELRQAAQPALDAVTEQHANAAYVKEIDDAVAALLAAQRAIPFLISKACMELGISTREIAALVENGEA